ncbi:uncharacterized protein LOC120084966 [Benincasa hispida]|uniref:uncharacterized protein LOC120084966 n=1 Tax=Benincasa hispida TaxID=102211 RepID=UPI001901C7B9|nr:uncharacterized protein LOC120084966 [Benincasa hispida]
MGVVEAGVEAEAGVDGMELAIIDLHAKSVLNKAILPSIATDYSTETSFLDIHTGKVVLKGELSEGLYKLKAARAAGSTVKLHSPCLTKDGFATASVQPQPTVKTSLIHPPPPWHDQPSYCPPSQLITENHPTNSPALSHSPYPTPSRPLLSPLSSTSSTPSSSRSVTQSPA